VIIALIGEQTERELEGLYRLMRGKDFYILFKIEHPSNEQPNQTSEGEENVVATSSTGYDRQTSTVQVIETSDVCLNKNYFLLKLFMNFNYFSVGM
jgi:glutathione peroxidase-family protein